MTTGLRLRRYDNRLRKTSHNIGYDDKVIAVTANKATINSTIMWHLWRTNTTSDSWTKWATQLTPSQFIIWLADEVADDLLANKPHNVSIEQLAEAVKECTASELQHTAERFLETFYYSCPSDNPAFFQTLTTFRHSIQQKILTK